ncbi:MAG: LemA family protein [Mogibacterium sp.]|nr:LemA family protein [Mogibacterium sp.]
MAVILIILVIIAVIVVICYNSRTKAKNRIEMAEEELRKYEESGTEEDILNARKYLTAVLRDYNNMVETFPTSIVAEMFNFPKMHTEDFDEGL